MFYIDTIERALAITQITTKARKQKYDHENFWKRKTVS